jgi:hypothetical protein
MVSGEIPGSVCKWRTVEMFDIGNLPVHVLPKRCILGERSFSLRYVLYATAKWTTGLHPALPIMTCVRKAAHELVTRYYSISIIIRLI